ncbi:alpha/beta fold hydrolase [Aestuariivita boseongensis]|uniref:alpha/beta fold hydrolase n=1 Tax=Aestuariivita boseongensis TaxID=1470562 RepID=UPI00068193CD|nr:alpha/beta hydrolase [Aestuariivita boseongensis]
MRLSGTALSAAIFAAAFANSAATDEVVLPRYEPLETCFFDMPEDVAFDCGNVIVPEFHDRRSENTISLGVIRLKSTSEEPRDPIFFGAGGPGGTPFTLLEIGALNDSDGYYGRLLANHDLVFFAQRGTAHSEPFLGCFGLNDLSDNYISGVYASWADLERDKLERLKACFDEAVAASVNLAAYNSLENAADVDSVRGILGYDQIIYYGESYGTMLGQHLMREYPDRLSAVVLDGALTTTYTSFEAGLDARFERALAYLVAMCSADEACNAAFPEFEDDLRAVHTQLQEAPYAYSVEGVTFSVDAEQFSLAIYDALYDVTQLRFVPLIVRSILNDSPNDTAPGFFVAPIPAQSETSLAFLMHFSVICSEDPTSSLDEAFTLDNLRFGDLVTDYVTLDANEYITMCAHMDLPTLPAETDEPVISNLPVLILNGGFDPVTPEMTAAPIAEALPNAYMVTFAYGDHVQGAIDACAHKIMTQFFADPTREPDGSCANERGAFEFAIP